MRHPEPEQTEPREMRMIDRIIAMLQSGGPPPREDMLQWMERTGFVMEPEQAEGESDA
jgi:hypothetical protein